MELTKEEQEYIKERELKRPLRAIHVWSLAVGVVIAGEYFGWNYGLPVGGPLGMLIASLFVCVLYLVWVLALAELSVALPFSGGPLAYGRRAVGPWFGFLMGWSMFLESLFATIGTGLAAGSFLAFLVNSQQQDPLHVTFFAVIVTVIFFALQCVGVREQATLALWLTYAAIGALVLFWVAVAPAVRLDRIVTDPLLPNGWKGVLGAVPYALWWLVVIEAVALSAEEVHEPERNLPAGLVWGQITLVGLVVATWFFAVGAGRDYQQTGAVAFPLSLVMQDVWGGTGLEWLVTAFSAVALAGLLVSFNGMLYSTSRQSYALGRAGYLPLIFGTVHVTRRTPTVSLFVWSLVTVGFIAWGYFNKQAIEQAILVSTLTALIWYILSIYCLFALRRSEPGLPRPYRVPVYPVLPVVVAILALFAAVMYSVTNINVLPFTLVLYIGGMVYYALWARKRLKTAAPEEVAARFAREYATANPSGRTSWLGTSRGEVVTALVLLLVVVSLGWIVIRAMGVAPLLPGGWEIVYTACLYALALGCVCGVALLTTQDRR
ncbi:MAG: amino acid permease [Candidatus Latescibacteria bacterium]|nr:amino acid permease [Candidatus Latescibacterota bacterium]